MQRLLRVFKVDPVELFVVGRLVPEQVDMQEGIGGVGGKIQHADKFVVVQVKVGGNGLDLFGVFRWELGQQVHICADQRVDFAVLLGGNDIGEFGVAVIDKELVDTRGRSFPGLRGGEEMDAVIDDTEMA